MAYIRARCGSCRSVVRLRIAILCQCTQRWGKRDCREIIVSKVRVKWEAISFENSRWVVERTSSAFPSTAARTTIIVSGSLIIIVSPRARRSLASRTTAHGQRSVYINEKEPLLGTKVSGNCSIPIVVNKNGCFLGRILFFILYITWLRILRIASLDNE